VDTPGRIWTVRIGFDWCFHTIRSRKALIEMDLAGMVGCVGIPLELYPYELPVLSARTALCLPANLPIKLATFKPMSLLAFVRRKNSVHGPEAYTSAS
jgi:hypothetical protein